MKNHLYFTYSIYDKINFNLNKDFININTSIHIITDICYKYMGSYTKKRYVNKRRKKSYRKKKSWSRGMSDLQI